VKLSIFALLTVSIIGCTPWPPAQEKSTYVNSNFERLKIRLDIIALKGGKDCLPGHLRKNQILSQRIEKEMNGGLIDDAQNDLTIFAKNISKMEKKLRYMAHHTKCAVEVGEKKQTQITSNNKSVLDLLLSCQGSFATNSSQVLPQYQLTLQKIAKYFVNNPEQSLHVQGFTDSRGSEKYNQTLSEDRAYAVKRLLMNAGVSEDRLITGGKGESAPIYENRTKPGQLANRRVELTLISASKTTPPQQEQPYLMKTKIEKVKDWAEELPNTKYTTN
jgi:outer membrane protein OmpA-like peptidoglycan-associated protein